MHTIPNLPAAVSREIFARLCAILPPPVIDTAEARAAREADAMQAVAALRPADAFEARLAVQIVAADTHAIDCFRLAAKYFNDLTAGLQCRAQAALMMRQMQAALRTLHRMQAMRAKTEATSQPAAPALGDVGNTRDATPAALTQQPDSVTEAEDYATRYPYRAARIRANGGLPARLDFSPPEPAIIRALVNGTSPVLRALDRCEAAAAA
jgi:hypothetical protein